MPKDIIYTFIILYTYNVYVYVYVYIYIHAYNVCIYIYMYIHIYIYVYTYIYISAHYVPFSNHFPVLFQPFTLGLPGSPALLGFSGAGGTGRVPA